MHGSSVDHCWSPQATRKILLMATPSMTDFCKPVLERLLERHYRRCKADCFLIYSSVPEGQASRHLSWSFLQKHDISQNTTLLLKYTHMYQKHKTRQNSWKSNKTLPSKSKFLGVVLWNKTAQQMEMPRAAEI